MRRTVFRPAVRVVAVGVLLLGLAGMALDVADFLIAGKFARQNVLDGLLVNNFWLSVALLGGIVYVLPGIRLARTRRVLVDGRGPFDFQMTFGPYIYRESVRRWLLRWALGLLCVLLAMCLGMSSRDLWRRGDMFEAYAYAIAWAEGVASPLLMITGLRALARRAESALRRNRRRPVLYLRSFAADAGPIGCLGDLFTLVFLGGLRDSPEVALRKAVANVGPLLAVGRPKEKLPSLGAARLYVRDDWQRVVASLAEESALVIFRPGKTQGFWWEVQHAVAHCDPRRVFLYLPKQDRGRTYASFRLRAAEFFPHPLPLKVGKATFLAFDPEWQPRLLGRGGPSTDADMRWLLGGRAPAVREALNEALGPLGFNAKPMPLHWKEWVGMGILVVLFFQCCCGVLAGLNAR